MTALRSLTESRSLTKWECSTKKQLGSWLRPGRSCLKTGPTCTKVSALQTLEARVVCRAGVGEIDREFANSSCRNPSQGNL